MDGLSIYHPKSHNLARSAQHHLYHSQSAFPRKIRHIKKEACVRCTLALPTRLGKRTVPESSTPGLADFLPPLPRAAPRRAPPLGSALPFNEQLPRKNGDGDCCKLPRGYIHSFGQLLPGVCFHLGVVTRDSFLAYCYMLRLNGLTKLFRRFVVQGIRAAACISDWLGNGL